MGGLRVTSASLARRVDAGGTSGRQVAGSDLNGTVGQRELVCPTEPQRKHDAAWVNNRRVSVSSTDQSRRTLC